MDETSNPDVTQFRNIARAASNRWYWPGADREDVEQEAMLALVHYRPSSPELAKAIVNRRLRDRLRGVQRDERRTDAYNVLRTHPIELDLAEIIDMRDRLRRIASLTLLEQAAVARRISDVPIRRSERQLDNALCRARRKLAA